MSCFEGKNREKVDTKNAQGQKTKKATKIGGFSSTPAGGRTLDTLIKSQVLYQLSYGSIVSGRKITHFFLISDIFQKLFFNYNIKYLKIR